MAAIATLEPLPAVLRCFQPLFSAWQRFPIIKDYPSLTLSKAR
jgi:hypothetical protein